MAEVGPDTLSRFSTIYKKGDNFLFALLHIKSLLKMGLL